MRFGEVRIDLERTLLRLDRLEHEIVDAHERSLQAIRAAKRRPGHRVLGIVPRGFLEGRNGSLERIACRQPHVEHPARVALVGFDRSCFAAFDLGDFRSAEHDVQALAQLVNNLVLQREDVANQSVDLDRLADFAGDDIHEVRGDAHQLAEALEPSDHDPRGAEPAADVDGQRFVQPRVGAQIAQRVEDAGAADDAQPVDVLEIRADRFRDPRADPVVVGFARDVGERHHGDRTLDPRLRLKADGHTARRAPRIHYPARARHPEDPSAPRAPSDSGTSAISRAAAR